MNRPRSLAAALALAALIGWSRGVPPTLAQSPERAQQQIPATSDGWIDSSIMLADGERAVVSASGSASWDDTNRNVGPGGAAVEICQPLAAGLPIGSLVARVGQGAPVLAQGATLVGPGPVAFAYNDCPGQFFNNTGAFTAAMEITRVVVPAPVAAPADAPAPPAEATPAAPKSGGGVPGWLWLLPLLALLGAGGWAARWFLTTPRPLFDETARLESSAWLAPMWLQDIQGSRLPKRALTVGGPDANIDFGVPGIRARLVPLEDGGTRIEKMGDGAIRVLVNGAPLILGQRLASGHRVQIGQREFVYFEERVAGRATATGKRKGAFSKPDPRAA